MTFTCDFFPCVDGNIIMTIFLFAEYFYANGRDEAPAIVESKCYAV